MATRTKAVNASRGVSVRSRDAAQPSAPIRVSDEARSKDTNAVRVQQAGFPGQVRNVLSERPNTSGGPSPHHSVRKEAESRRAQDDIHLQPLPTHGRVMNSHSHSPTVLGALPTPVGTPKSSPPLPQRSPLKGTDTPESMMDGRLAPTSVDEEGIGMALGSPSQLPAAWQHPPPVDSTARSWSPDEPSPQIPTRQKSRKWRLLGGLFGGSKKQSPALEPQPFYQLQPESVNHAMESPDYAPFAEPTMHSDRRPSATTAGRGRAYSERHSSKNKPDMRRANTVPMNFDSQGPESERMKPPHITLDGGQMRQAESHHGGLMLNVDIPSVEMERYSVMFGSVLQKPTGASSSSLLARRQATLERLKTVTEAMPKHERDHRGSQRHPMPRRASSPQPAKSPAFSLFPNAPARLYATPVPPSPPGQHTPHHRRVNTSPAVPSPSLPSFPSKTEHETHGPLLAPAPQHVAPSPKLKDHISSQMRVSAKELKKTPSNLSIKQQKTELAAPHGKPRQTTHPAPEKAEDGRSSDPSHGKPKPTESARQIIRSPRENAAPRSTSGPQPPLTSLTRGYSVSITASGTTTTTTTSTTRSASTRHNSPMQSTPPSSLFRNLTTTSAPVRANATVVSPKTAAWPTRGDSRGPSQEDDEEEREKKLRTAADISIARQISVSREQTRLIIPMRSPSSKRANSPNALTIGQVASPLGVVAAGGEHSPAGRASSRKDEAKKATKGRLADPAAKPNTPTLVIVGGDSAEEGWEGATASHTGEGEGKPRGVAEHRYRKSERVVFESID